MTIAEKTTFILNNEYIEQVALLNDAQAGQLFRACNTPTKTKQTILPTHW